jgi:hypothetical protein
MRRAAAYMQAWSPVIGRLLYRPVRSPRHFGGVGGAGPNGGSGGGGPRGRIVANGQAESGGGDGSNGGLWGAYNRALERAPVRQMKQRGSAGGTVDQWLAPRLRLPTLNLWPPN